MRGYLEKRLLKPPQVERSRIWMMNSLTILQFKNHQCLQSIIYLLTTKRKRRSVWILKSISEVQRMKIWKRRTNFLRIFENSSKILRKKKKNLNLSWLKTLKLKDDTLTLLKFWKIKKCFVIFKLESLPLVLKVMWK